jgi:hypothetical protein
VSPLPGDGLSFARDINRNGLRAASATHLGEKSNGERWSGPEEIEIGVMGSKAIMPQ